MVGFYYENGKMIQLLLLSKISFTNYKITLIRISFTN